MIYITGDTHIPVEGQMGTGQMGTFTFCHLFKNGATKPPRRVTAAKRLFYGLNCFNFTLICINLCCFVNN